MKKGLDERIDESMLRWFGHVERKENDRIAKRVYVGEYVDIVHWVGRGYRKGLFKEKRFGYQASKENGAG